MKRILLLFLLCTASVFGAIASTTVWEVRSAGNIANGGHFNTGNANFITDYTATSATGNAPVISSATYSFVAGDVGAWIYVKAGTNWTAGFYKIDSVAANAATVNGTIGAAVQVVNDKYIPNTVAGVATVASPTGGTIGVDFSQQDAAELTATDLACTTPSTTVTSAGAGFRRAFVGNGLKLASGTGAGIVLHWFEIVSYTNTTTVVLDKTPAPSANLTNGNFRVGGGIAAIGNIGSATAGLGYMPGNAIFVTQGGGAAFSLPGSDTVSVVGTVTLPVRIMGYATYRGDYYLGRTATTAKLLITTKMPSYQYQATFRLAASSATFTTYEGINFSAAGAGVSSSIMDPGSSNLIINCVVTNPSTNAAAVGIASGSASGIIIYNNDVFMTGASGATNAISVGAAGILIAANYIACSSTTATSAAILAGSSSTFITENTMVGTGGLGISAASASNNFRSYKNTLVGFLDSHKMATGLTSSSAAIGNMVTDNTGYAFNGTDTTACLWLIANRTRDNTSGAMNPTTNNSMNRSNYFPVTTDTGDSSTDYVDFAGKDLRLISGSPGTSAALPVDSSMGSRQRNQVTAATGGGSYTF